MTLIVDYGIKRVKMPYKIVQGNQWLEADRWCTKTFKFGEHQRADGYFYFKKQKHLMLFLLKWGA